MKEVVPVQGFGGLNIRDEPDLVGASGCIDALNCDLDKRGSVRVRDGYDNFTTAAAAARYRTIIPFYRANGTAKLIATRGGDTFDVINTSGGVDSSKTPVAGITLNAVVRYGSPSAEYIIFSYSDSFRLASWDGTTATGYGGPISPPRGLAVQAPDNRLVVAAGPTAATPSRVYFSDAGDPTTFGTNNYVDLTPGDGETLNGLCSWREFVFVWKESKFFAFYGNSTDSTGAPVFNVRTIHGTGIPPWAESACVAAPEGVYFVGNDGIYFTTGGPPRRISDAIKPLFTGDVSSFYTGSALNKSVAGPWAGQVAYHDGRLYVSLATGASTTNNRTFVYDPQTEDWMPWSIPAGPMCSFKFDGQPNLMFSYASGTHHIGRISSSYTTDDGSAISSKYRSGFYTLGNPASQEIVVRETVLDGIGAPIFSLSADFGSVPTSGGGARSTVTLGTSPAYGQGRHTVSQKGRRVSYQLERSSGSWRVNSIIHHLVASRSPGLNAA